MWFRRDDYRNIRYLENMIEQSAFSIKSIVPEEVGVFNYLNLALKAVSKDGSNLQNVRSSYRTKSICIAAVLSCKAQGLEMSYSLSAVPKKYLDECSNIYQFSQEYDKNSGNQIESDVRAKMETDFQNEDKHLEAFEKIKKHIKNLNDFGNGLDKLYTLMREYKDIESYSRDPEEAKYNKFKKQQLKEEIYKIEQELKEKLKDLTESEADYFEATHFCNSKKDITYNVASTINDSGELLARRGTDSRISYQESLNSILSNNSIRDIEELAQDCRNKISLFMSNIDWVTSDDKKVVSEETTKFKWSINWIGVKDVRYDGEFYYEIEEAIDNAYDEKQQKKVIKNEIIPAVEEEFEKRAEVINNYINDMSKADYHRIRVLVQDFAKEISKLKKYGTEENLETIKEDLNQYILKIDEFINECIKNKSQTSQKKDEQTRVESAEESEKAGVDKESIRPEKGEITETNPEKVVVQNPNKIEEKEESLNKENNQKEQTLRQKFDINNEEDFDNLLVHYAQANKEYYSGDGVKKTDEEIKKRKNLNSQFKRILTNKAKQMPQNEDGEDFSSTITSIEKGEVFDYFELKVVAESKGATLRLFNIMASGVYEKDGKKIRLTQKQRIALSSTLEIVSGMRLDMDNNKKKTQTKSTNEQTILKDSTLGEQ